jgi:TonB family protein
MNSNPDPAFAIKQQLDREVARRFDARRFRGLDAPEWRDTRGPLARIPVAVQWLGIAAALIAAVTGLRSLYVDLTRGAAKPAPVESVSAPPSKPEIAPPPVVQRVDEPVASAPRRPAPHARVPLPPEPREQPAPTVAGPIAPADDAPVAAAAPPAPPPERVARATPPAAIVAVPEPAKVVRPEPVQPAPAFATSGGVVATMPSMGAGGVAVAGFSAKGQNIPATVRELPMLGATIVSLVGAPDFSSDDESPMNPPRSGTGTARSSPSSSYYIRLLAGSRSHFPSAAEVEPVLVTKTLLAEPPGKPKELWGSQAQEALLKSAFALGSLVDLAGLRTIAPGANLDAQADLVAVMFGRVFRVRVSAGPNGADGAARFDVRLATGEPGRTQEIEGALSLERDRVVILALPDPRRVRWGGGIGPDGATVFVVLSSRAEESDRGALAEQNVDPPILIRGPEPRYPDEARWHRTTGKVVVRARVRKDGTIDDPQIQEAPTGPGAQSLVNAALAAVSARTYLPARSSGEPVEAYVTITIEFKDDGASIVDEPGE